MGTFVHYYSYLYSPYRNSSIHPENQVPVKKQENMLTHYIILTQKMSTLQVQLNGIWIETYQLISGDSAVFVQLLFRHIALENKQQQGKH